MPRPLVLGNGRMLVCLDDRLVIRDLYFPRVGQVNHIAGERTGLGVFAGGQFAWLSDQTWERQIRYLPDTLVTDVHAVHPHLGLSLHLHDGVHPRHDLLIRRVRLRNLRAESREVRLFATFDFDLDETDLGDTALWEPSLGVIFHYKRNRWILIGGEGPASGSIDQYATGRKRFGGSEGTWRDAEDGHLEGHPISQGSVDSTIGLHARLAPEGSADFALWVVCAADYRSAKALHGEVARAGPARMLEEAEGYWRSWVISGRADLTPLPDRYREAYRRSLLILRTQVDMGGAIIAANDSDILAYNRDHYSYMWPRDGALVAAALDRAGYGALTRPFYRFCEAGLSDEGFLWHKYNPDGSVGSSWHPWVGPKGLQLPIQEDETALVLWALGHYYRMRQDHEFVGRHYGTLVRRAADFLVGYRDPATGLPLESYDLWEERRGVFTFTTAAVVAGLRAAAQIAGAVGDSPGAARYAEAAQETMEAMLQHLWSEEEGRFVRGIYPRGDGPPVVDLTPESSTMGPFLLGLLPADDPRMEATARRIEEHLQVRTAVGGIARYRDDYYFRPGGGSAEVPGNPWVICTLWLARWHLARARTMDELEPATRLIDWTLRYALLSGALPEQLDPHSGYPLSVAPLTWSHSTLIDTLLDLSGRLRTLGAQAG